MTGFFPGTHSPIQSPLDSLSKISDATDETSKASSSERGYTIRVKKFFYCRPVPKLLKAWFIDVQTLIYI